jgi:hypothetical protein
MKESILRHPLQRAIFMNRKGRTLHIFKAIQMFGHTLYDMATKRTNAHKRTKAPHIKHSKHMHMFQPLLLPFSGKCFTKDDCINTLLDLRTLITEKLHDDGTLMPKHVGFGARYEVCFIIYFIVI